MGLAQALDAARGRIAVGAGIARRLAEFLHDMVGRGHVGIAHAEIDDVFAARARLGLEAIDFLEDIRRQPLDAVEIGVHRGILIPRIGDLARPRNAFIAVERRY